MEVGLNLAAQHAHGVASQLAVDVGVLADDVDDFLTGHHVDFVGVVAQLF